jgi:hypothetical protein
MRPEKANGGRGARRLKGGAEAGAPRRVGRRVAADWGLAGRPPGARRAPQGHR